MLIGVVSCKSIIFLFVKHRFHQINALERQLAEFFVSKVNTFIQYIVQNFLICFAVKRNTFQHHCKEDYTSAPNICFTAVVTSYDFRSDIIRRTKMFMQSLALFIINSCTCSKVNNFYNISFCIPKKYIFWLDITVNQIVGVQVLEYHNQLINNTCTLSFCKSHFLFSFGIHQLKQLATSAQLHNYIVTLFVLEILMDLYAVWMVKLLHYFNFLHISVCFSLFEESLFHYLHSPLRASLFVLTPKDLGMSSLTEQALPYIFVSEIEWILKSCSLGIQSNLELVRLLIVFCGLHLVADTSTVSH